MTIIGVSDESPSKVKPYIEKNGIEYVIAIKGASDYQARGIPHAWLVSPGGEIVWEGHPARLQNATIDKYIKHARLTPTFRLPPDLSRAERYLNAGSISKGLDALEKYLRKPKAEDVAEAARAATERATSFGKKTLQEVEECAKEGDYTDGLTLLSLLEKAFKGTEIGDQAKKKRAAWRKDAKIRDEVEADLILEKAKGLVQAKEYKTAYAYLLRITKSRKYAETRAREEAEETIRSIEKHL